VETEKIQIFVQVVGHAYKCYIRVRHRTNECQSKEKHNLLKTLVRHMSYKGLTLMHIEHRDMPNLRGVCLIKFR